MKNIDCVNDLASQIIENRERTQESRFKKLSSDVERVSDVIEEFMNQLCEELSEHKFKYSKGKKHLYKTVDGFKFEISCRSDSSNLSGVYVGISFLISVSHSGYKIS